jgi:hypothetical protein
MASAESVASSMWSLAVVLTLRRSRGRRVQKRRWRMMA